MFRLPMDANHHRGDQRQLGTIGRPQVVAVAVGLMWSMLFVSGFLIFQRAQWYESNLENVISLVPFVIVALIWSALTVLLSRGRNWARFAYLAVAVISFFAVFRAGWQALETSIFVTLIGMLPIVAHAVVLTLLFLPVSNRWFKVAGRKFREL
jgi:hypothetical protein